MPSRISGACNGCRTKKQKCSGDRSGCKQCHAAGIICTWPAQRKRGPAKGYIEGLEHRLHEAESLLLRLLPITSSDQLSAAVSELLTDQRSNTVDSPDGQSGISPPVLNKKTGIDYWESFPLDSVDNIRRWEQDCANNSQDLEESNHPSRSRQSSTDFSKQIDLLRSSMQAQSSSFQQSWDPIQQLPSRPMDRSEPILQNLGPQTGEQSQRGLGQMHSERNTTTNKAGPDQPDGTDVSEIQRRLFW